MKETLREAIAPINQVGFMVKHRNIFLTLLGAACTSNFDTSNLSMMPLAVKS